MIDHPATAAAIELVTASLARDHPDRAAAAAELRRRWELARRAGDLWHTAVEQAGDGFTRLDPAAAQQAALDAGYDPADLEPARAYLAALTLIYELWVLQEAGVEPENLYATTENVRLVREVLHREATRHEAHLTAGTAYDLPDPLGAGAHYLARAVDLALFAAPEQLHEQLLRWAGDLHEDVLPELRQLCADALAGLQGPWALDRALANPGFGKHHHRPHQPVTTPFVTGFDVALGRPGLSAADTAAELTAARRTVETELATEIARLTGTTGPRDGLLAARPDAGTLAHAATTYVTGFFTAALTVTRIAGDDVMRVDGRPVPDDMRAYVLDEHRQAASWQETNAGGRNVAVQPALPSTTITVAGLAVRFRPDTTTGALLRELQATGTMPARAVRARTVVAEIDATGMRAHFDTDRIHGVLDVLGRPDAVTHIAEHAVRRAIHTTAGLHLTSMGPRPTTARHEQITLQHPPRGR